jgi:serine/threonine protein kinase
VTDEVPAAAGEVGAGALIASYRLEEQIGWGGMAVVYRALDVRLDRWVALKILAPEIARDDSFRQRFISESRAAAAVDHPHIIPVFEAGEAGGILFIAMRYVGGGDVRTLFRRLGPLDAARVTSIVAQVGSALDASHAIGLVHRDVKPANILLAVVAGGGRPDHVYLADFGLSKQALSMAGLTQTGQFVGTLDYMAPEQIEARPVDGRADLYALACAAFEMFSGSPPFQRNQDLGAVFAQLSLPPPALTARRPDLPPAVDRVFARALAKSPDDRYASCLDFATALRAACGLEWAASGLVQPAPPRAATELAAPGRMPGPPGSPPPAAGPANARDLATGQAWPAAALPPQPSRMSGRPGPAGQGWGGPASPGQERSGPSPPGQPWSRPPSPGQEWSSPPPPGHGWSESSPAGHGPASQYPATAGGRSRWRAFALAIAAAIVILGLAGGAAALLRDRGSASSASSPPPAAGQSQAGSVNQSGAAKVRGPAATVRAYIAAINGHHYLRAWKLGGRNGPSPYPEFVRGFATTAKDTLTVVSVNGDVVTARLSALQTNGSVQGFQGTYTVEHGVITRFNVHPVA